MSTTPYPVPRSTRQTDILVGNGGKVYGPFDGLQIFDNEDVVVYSRATTDVPFSAVPVTVAKVSGLSFDFFTIEFAENVPATTQFVVSSERVAERSAGVKKGTQLDMTALEKELSKIATTDQELRRDVDRAVKADFGAAEQTLPPPDNGRFLGWSNGKLANLSVENVGTAVFGDVGRQVAQAATTGDAHAALQTGAFVDARQTKVAGEDSTGRTWIQRFGDQIDLRDLGFVLTGAVGSEAANAAALDRLIAHAAANPGMVYRARKGDVIRLDTAGGGKTIPKCRLRFEGAEFHWVGNFGGTASPVLMLGQFVDFDALTAAVPAGGLFRRMFRLIGDNRGDYIKVECENQIANWSGSNLDYAVAIYGHRNKVRSIKTKNVDWGAFVYGEGSAGFPQLDTTIGEFDIENYAVGFVIRNVTRFANPGGRVRGKSVNALPDPGYNACLIEGARDSVFGDYQLFDAGEHNLRFGGIHSGEQLTRNCSLGSLLSGRAGQCGFKIWSGLNTDIIRGMTFGPMNIFDCGMYAQGLSNPPNFNDFGVMVQGLIYSSFGVINVYKQNAAYSAFDAGYFSQCQDVQVAHLNGFGAKRNILRISEYNGNSTDSNATNSLAFTRVNGSGHEAEGIVVQVPTNSMRDLSIDDFYIIGGTDAFKWDGALARAVQPCYFRGGARGFSGVKFNAPGGTNIKTVDKYV